VSNIPDAAILWCVEYSPRIVDAELRRRLAANGAVVIEGPKASGKTRTAREQAASYVFLDTDLSAQQAAEIDPSLVLDGSAPRLIDEWQVVPAIWNYVRREVDQRGVPGQFLLTGSATPADDARRHTGAGRFGRVLMRPMSLFELGRSSGEISVAKLLSGGASRSPDGGLTLRDLIDEVVRGGWPGFRTLAVRDAADAVRDYLESVSRTDIRAVDGVRRDPERVRRVLRSLARHVGTQATLTTIAADASRPARGPRIIDDTVGEYLNALRRLMIVEDQPAWNTHLRSAHQLRTLPTRHFVDPSLAVAALRSNSNALLEDLNAFGLLFESMVVRDLRVYAQPLGGELFHYRDKSGLEVDAIIDTGDQWAAFEIKLGVGQIEQAAENLLKFAARVVTVKRGEPAVLGVIVGTGLGYVRPDGVHVIPIGALGA
jgi:predicted AAA+ superfamily ATPase